MFLSLPSQLDAEAADGLSAIYQFELSGQSGGRYVLSIDAGACTVTEGTHSDPHVTLAMSGDDALKILTGQLSGQLAAMTGRLSVNGDVGLAMQLRGLFPSLQV